MKSFALPENPLLLVLFFLNEVFFILFLIKFEKYQMAILRPSSPDSISIIGKKTSQKSGF